MNLYGLLKPRTRILPKHGYQHMDHGASWPRLKVEQDNVEKSSPFLSQMPPWALNSDGWHLLPWERITLQYFVCMANFYINILLYIKVLYIALLYSTYVTRYSNIVSITVLNARASYGHVKNGKAYHLGDRICVNVHLLRTDNYTHTIF